jgi:hypothetical protein
MQRGGGYIFLRIGYEERDMFGEGDDGKTDGDIFGDRGVVEEVWVWAFYR